MAVFSSCWAVSYTHLVGLSWFDAGVRSFYTREKVETLADLAGLTLRVQESDMMSAMILDLGAKPAQVVHSRVDAALHNAEIDGAENKMCIRDRSRECRWRCPAG